MNNIRNTLLTRVWIYSPSQHMKREMAAGPSSGIYSRRFLRICNVDVCALDSSVMFERLPNSNTWSWVSVSSNYWRP